MIRTRLLQLKKSLERQYDVYNRIEISRSALLHNIDFFAHQTGLDVIPVLKGNAYGHGIEQVATALKSKKLSYVAVDGYFEALRVRRFSKQPVLILGMIQPQNFSKLHFQHFTFVVQDMATIDALGRLGKRVKIHLELNTGMNRYGIPLKDLDTYITQIKAYPKLKLEGVMSHLADADGDDDATVDGAVKLFDESIEKILKSGLKPTMFHIGQSAGSLRVKSKYANATRIGIGFYGINPMLPKHPLYKTYDLKPAMRLVSAMSKINELAKGDKVSYNYTFTAPKPMRVGVLPLGYFEGVNRALSNQGSVKIGDHFQPIAGRVCMNHTMINLAASNAKAGDEVVVYSNDPNDENSIDNISAQHGLFAYTLLTGLSPDVRRILVD